MSRVEPEDSETVEGEGATSVVELTPFEREVIEIFVRVAEVLGMARSVAEIYGLLYASPKPLAFSDVVDRLAMSKGSASQGLRLLRNLGAVRPVLVAGDRRDFFEPVIELRKLVAGFLREKVEPGLAAGKDRMVRLRLAAEEAGKDLPVKSRRHLEERVVKIERWHRQAQRFLPLAGKLID